MLFKIMSGHKKTKKKSKKEFVVSPPEITPKLLLQTLVSSMYKDT